MTKKILSILVVLLIYALTFIGGIFLFNALGSMNTLLKYLIVDVCMTTFIFIFSCIFGNASIYDPYWSLVPMVAVWFMYDFKVNEVFPLALIVIGLIELWGLRLTINWAIHFKNLKHEDWRYTRYRQNHPKLFLLISYFGIHLVPTLVVFAGMLSPISFLEKCQMIDFNLPFNVATIMAICISFFAIVIETVADIQSMYYRKKYPNELLTRGLWKRSRHPNYLGEIMFWLGLWLILISLNNTMWVLFLGPLAVMLLFAFISIPMMERHMIEKHPEYKEYIKTTNVLLIFPKKSVTKEN